MLFKKIILSFCLLFSFIPLYAQSEEPYSYLKEEHKPRRMPIFAFSTFIGGAMVVEESPFITGLNMELMLGSRYSKIYFYSQLKIAFTPTILNIYGINTHILLGIGGIIFDFRNDNLIGWTMVANGGLQWGGAAPFKNKGSGSELLIHKITLQGAEVNTRFRYHVNPYLAIQLGLEFGGNIGFTAGEFINNDIYFSFSFGLAI